MLGEDALSESSMRAVVVLIACAGPGWSWQFDAVLMLLIDNAVLRLLLLLLMGDAVLLSLVASGAGGDGHLPLTKKLSMQRVWSNLTCVAMGPRRAPETGRELIFYCCSIL